MGNPDDRQNFKEAYRDAIERAQIPDIENVRQLVIDLLSKEPGQLPVIAAFLRPFIEHNVVPITWLTGDLLREIYAILKEKERMVWKQQLSEAVLRSRCITIDSPVSLSPENKNKIEREAIQKSIDYFGFDKKIVALKDVEQATVKLIQVPYHPQDYLIICSICIRTNDGRKEYGPSIVGGITIG